jgi:hypothetical protein
MKLCMISDRLYTYMNVLPAGLACLVLKPRLFLAPLTNNYSEIRIALLAVSLGILSMIHYTHSKV